jgi:ketosteroid isomerase-like protein
VDVAFDAAQRLDMESFRDFDREAWRAVHAVDAVSILPAGVVLAGREQIVDALAAHFDERRARWSWTELSRRLQPGRVGHVLYETVYEIPVAGVRQRALTGVTFACLDGSWLVVCDQGTALP